MCVCACVETIYSIIYFVKPPKILNAKLQSTMKLNIVCICIINIHLYIIIKMKTLNLRS